MGTDTFIGCRLGDTGRQGPQKEEEALQREAIGLPYAIQRLDYGSFWKFYTTRDKTLPVVVVVGYTTDCSIEHAGLM